MKTKDEGENPRNYELPVPRKSTTMPTTQIAALVENPGPNAQIRIYDDCPIPEPGPGEVLVKLEVTGLWYSQLSQLVK